MRRRLSSSEPALEDAALEQDGVKKGCKVMPVAAKFEPTIHVPVDIVTVKLQIRRILANLYRWKESRKVVHELAIVFN